MGCDYGGQGGRCSRCGIAHPHSRSAEASYKALEKSAEAVQAIQEQARRKKAAFQMRMGI